MADLSLAQLSNTLFDVAFVGYAVAMVAYFFRLAFTRVRADGVVASTTAGRRIGLLGTSVASAAVLVHLGSVVARGVAAGRVPWANMYEYSSLLSLGAVAVGLLVVQRRLGYGHLMGFVLGIALVSMGSALVLFTPAGPVVPALNSYWLVIHTFAAATASSILTVAFAATALYLVKDTAERRVAARSGAAFSGSTVGAAHVDAPVEERPEGYEADGALAERSGLSTPLAQREVLSRLRFALVPFVIVGLFTLSIQKGALAALGAGVVGAAFGLAARYATPFLPPAANLDNLAYRTTTFGFPILTFMIMAGAIWAEEAWGRYWGWDPKETGAFFTWVIYAAYLHARSTHGWRGRRAAWVGVAGFTALAVTYYAVNLWVVGLHSYAGV